MCHKTCHVHSDSRGLVAKQKSTKSLHSHDKQVSVAPCSYFLLHIATWLSSSRDTLIYKHTYLINTYKRV